MSQVFGERNIEKNVSEFSRQVGERIQKVQGQRQADRKRCQGRNAGDQACAFGSRCELQGGQGVHGHGVGALRGCGGAGKPDAHTAHCEDRQRGTDPADGRKRIQIADFVQAPNRRSDGGTAGCRKNHQLRKTGRTVQAKGQKTAVGCLRYLPSGGHQAVAGGGRTVGHPGVYHASGHTSGGDCPKSLGARRALCARYGFHRYGRTAAHR